MFPDVPAKTHFCFYTAYLWVPLQPLSFKLCSTLVLKIGKLCPEYDKNIKVFLKMKISINFLFVVLSKDF